MISNRFWVATPIYLALAIIIAVIEHFKITIRYEAVIPSDLSFLKSDAGNLMSFMPSGAQWIILGAVAGFLVLLGLCLYLNRIDARHGRMFRAADHRTGLANAAARILLVIIPAGFFGMYAMQAGTVGSWANTLSVAMGDQSSMWDSVYDAQRHGPVDSFLRQLNPMVME